MMSRGNLDDFFSWVSLEFQNSLITFLYISHIRGEMRIQEALKMLIFLVIVPVNMLNHMLP